MKILQDFELFIDDIIFDFQVTNINFLEIQDSFLLLITSFLFIMNLSK